MHGMYVTYMLKMCMKKFNAIKIFFDKFDKFTGSVHCGGYTVSLACSQFLVSFSTVFRHLKPLNIDVSCFVIVIDPILSKLARYKDMMSSK